MKTIYLSGLVVALTPFLGIPYSWKTILLVILGAVIFTRGYIYYKNNKKELGQLEMSFKQNEESLKTLSSTENSIHNIKGEGEIKDNKKNNLKNKEDEKE